MDNESPRLQPQVGAAGKYKILKRIAVGGMAEIYLAEAANIHGFRKKVVIKRMLPQYATEQAYIEMFLDEARLVARLNHPSVVQVFDIGEDREGVFFTMEYVQGHDLSEILGSCYRAHRQLSFAEVLAIAIPAAEGLHHAHEARDDSGALINLIHRDVSPSNVIVTNAGRVKLLDFGVAKSRSQSRETTGVSLKGKFGYMAPEQCEGLAIDRRCDVYSFGVVLWELFTGKRLHGGGNEPSVLVKIMTQDPPAPSSIRHDIPPTLDAICLKALARNRDNRYSTMQELLVDLDRYMSESGTVISSRTLSTMLENVFAEERPTMAMAMPTPDDLATQERPASQLAQSPAAYVPGAGSDGGHGQPGSGGHGQPGSGARGQQASSNGGHGQPGSGARGQQAGSNGGHGQPGSGGGHQAQAGSNPSGGYQNQAHRLMNATGPLPAVGGMTPGHGYATLRPGTQFDQGSEIVVPMKSRKGIVIAIIGTVVVLGLGLFVISGSEDAPATEESDEASESTVLEDSLEPDKPAVVPAMAEQTPEELAAAKEKAAADKLAEEKAAAADKVVADKAAAEKAAAEKAAAAAKLAEDKAEAAKLAQEEKAAAAKLAEEKAAAAAANSSKSTEAKAAAKAAAQAKRAEERAAAKLAKDKAAADRAAARAASRAAAAKKAQERAAERKAAAALRNANKPKDREKKPPKWDPNSPFAPQ